MSPESFEEIKIKEGDVYSLLCIAWELLTRHKEQPFEGQNKNLEELNLWDFVKLVGINKNMLKIPAECNSKLAELMKKSWNPNPKERPSLAKIRTELSQLLESDDLPENVIEYDPVYDKYELLQCDEEYEYDSQDEEETSDESEQSSNENYDSEDDDFRQDQNDVKPDEDGADYDSTYALIPNLF